MSTLLRAVGGLLLATFVLALIAFRVIFGLALYVIAFGAAYIILWELGVL
jgi:hypothetical protein